MSPAKKLKRAAAMKVYDFVDKDPERNIPRLLDALCRLDESKTVTSQSEAVKAVFSEPDNGWRDLILSLWTDIDDFQRRKLFETVAVNATLIGSSLQNKLKDKYGCNVPWAILFDPASACNLRCTGCWAAEYGHNLNLTFDEMESIIKQGEEMGVYFYVLSGGEPMVRKKEIIALCERHPECAFLAFTNGTLIDEAFADEMLRVGNFVPAISVEGFEEDTDFRRGEGTYRAVMKTCEILKRKKLLFGMSCCYTSKNAEIIGSEEYFDAMIGCGAKFCWLFTYMPVGKKAVPELMATAEQRSFMYEAVRAYRGVKPIFTIDFWNDGEFVQGCIAGGRRYLHINANGDIEPCAFAHYSDSNIRSDKIFDALRKPLFMAYHDNQPFNRNMLRPCPVLDNPGALADMVEKSGAHSTDIAAPEDARDIAKKCAGRAADWAKVSEELWEKSLCEKCRRY